MVKRGRQGSASYGESWCVGFEAGQAWYGAVSQVPSRCGVAGGVGCFGVRYRTGGNVWQAR